MLLTLNPDSGLPLHSQIAAAVRRAIADGQARPGDRLPAARDLARSLKVNMHTVLRAYGKLRDENLIELRRGRGAIVRKGPIAVARIRHMAVELVTAAQRQGLSLEEVVQLVEEEYS